MRVEISDEHALREISPQALAAFARSQGWERTEQFGKHSDVYVVELGPEVIIPRTSRLGDYAGVVATLIQRFAEYLGQDELSVYRSLVGANHDVIRVRAFGGQDDGTIALESGVELVARSREMLLAAACAVKQPQRLYRAGANKDASVYMSRVRLGQTEHGSFVVTLLSPVAPDLQTSLANNQWRHFEDEPVERQVTRRLFDALAAAREAAETAFNESVEVFEQAVQRGVSANLCESLAGMLDQSNDLLVSLLWAKTRPEPELASTIEFSGVDADTFREAGRLLRSKEPREDQTLFGPVVRLRRDESEDDGFVTMTAMIDEAPRAVGVRLDQTGYRAAIEAHKSKHLLVVRGDLEKAGNRWTLQNARVQQVDRSVAEPQLSEE